MASNTRRPDQPGGVGYSPEQEQNEEEVLDGADLEFIEDTGPPTDPAMDPLLDPGDTDPATSFEQQQEYTPTPLDPAPAYPGKQPQAPAYPAQAPAYPAGQQPAAPQAATMPPDQVQYDPQQQGYAPAAQQAGYPPQQQGYPATTPYPPHSVEDEPTSQQDQAAIQAAIDGKPYTEGPKLLIIGGNNRGKECPLNHSGDTTIGRGVDNHIILADIAVSRKHTLICHEGGQFVVRDLGSGNGTLLNGSRVDSQALKDGDQLELGNTLMRYVNPLAVAQAAAPAPILQTSTDKLDEEGLMAGGPVSAAPAPVASPQPVGGTPYPPPGAPLAPAPAPAPAGGMDRRRKLLIFGGVGLVVFFGLLIGLKALIGGKDTEAASQGPSPDEVAAQQFQEGTTQFRAKNWEKARTHFLKVLELAPKFEDARRYAEQAASELKAKGALEESGKSLKAKDFKAARLALTKVPSRSSYTANARKAKQKIDDEQLAFLLQEAKKLKEQGDVTGALARATEARDLAPTNQVVKDLVAELSAAAPGDTASAKPAVAAATPRKTGGTSARQSGGSSPRKTGGSTTRTREPKVKPIKFSGSGAKQALALYKEQQWAQAFSSIKSYASAQSGSRKRKAEALADAIRKVGQSWLRAAKSSNAAQALKYYQQAMIYDRKVTRGGMHQATLKELIFKQARKESSTALARGKYTTAYAAYKLALRYGKEDAVLRKVASDLEKKAQALFTKGYTKRSSNIAYARKCWQQVLKMVPPSSSAYQKSYKWLNESTPSYEDEDED